MLQDKLRKQVNMLLGLLLLTQIFMWYFTSKQTPNLGIVPEVPTINEARAVALGDEQFYFRYLSLNLQNSGDSFGRFTALRDYDYELLMKWFKLLDELDSQSHFVPAIASYYYSNTQNVEDNIYIVDYLESAYDKDPADRWWWLAMGVSIANFKLKDLDLALRLSFKLSRTPGGKIPRWAQQMPAIISAQMGEKDVALNIIKELATKYDNYTQAEINYMNYFIREMLGYINDSVDVQPTEMNVEPMYPELTLKNPMKSMK